MNFKIKLLSVIIFPIIVLLNNSLTFARLSINNLKLKHRDKQETYKLNTSDTDSDSAKKFGKYTPNAGFKILETENGDVNFSIFSYIRYLNQNGLDATYTNSFGDTSLIRDRNDIQVNKVNIKFFGWFMDPKFRYLFYVWTSNTALGQSSQVVVAGNLQYNLNEHFTFGAGINALPGVRTTEGNFPFWLPVDNRLIADEYFRPSYTTGLWAKGKVTDRLTYNAMVGNNLSQFGIDAGQLDASLKTFSGALDWFPTTGEFGLNSGFGDFENHNKAATRLAGHFTYSEEDIQSQPTSDNFDNVQLRLSDGSVLFKPDLFGNGIRIRNANYKMTSVDYGIKYKGFALEGEFYWRWLSNFTGPGTDSLDINLIKDNGFQVMTSYMIIHQRLQAFTTFSQVFGDYGNPWEARIGLNYFPWKNQAVRWNIEYIQIYRSPVGGLSVPYPIGGTGGIFNTDFMVNF